VTDGGFRLENKIDLSFCLGSIMTNKLKGVSGNGDSVLHLIFYPLSDEEDKLVLFFGQSKAAESNNFP